MQTVTHIKKKDVVQIMSGSEKGKTGKVLRVNHKHGRVLVEKINLRKRHTKPTAKGPGGIIESEGPLMAAKVLLFCEKCNRGVRTRNKALDDGKKVRVCAKCDNKLDK